MWKVTAIINRADKPKLSELGTLLDLADEIAITEDGATAIQNDKYHSGENFTAVVARHQPLVDELGRIQDKADVQSEQAFAPESELNSIREAGSDAYVDGGRLEDNPYAPNSERWKFWRAGFLDGSATDADADDQVC